jgi:hypothetical protein
LPHDRARKLAQDAASRNREPAMNDFSDGWRASLTKTRFKAPSTRRQQTDSRHRVLDGPGLRKFVEVLDRLH